MLTRLHILVLVASLSLLPAQAASRERDRASALQKIRTAKTVYFDDQSHVAPSVGDKARTELKKWGRYKIVDDRRKADLIILFSLRKYNGGYEIHPGGPTGATNMHGQSQEDLAQSYVQIEPAQAGFLTVIDPETGDALWSESHRWGGLLTGFDSVGVRLVKEFKKAVK